MSRLGDYDRPRPLGIKKGIDHFFILQNFLQFLHFLLMASYDENTNFPFDSPFYPLQMILSSKFGNMEILDAFFIYCKEKFGTKIDKGKMKTMDGKKELVKQCLNSLCDQYYNSLRDGSVLQTMIMDSEHVFEYLLRRIDIVIFPPLDQIVPGVLLINYILK